MAPKIKITKEDIKNTAVEIVKESGAEALNARALASRLGCSTQPIFSNYSSMGEIKADVISAADDVYHSYLKNEMERGNFKPYKAMGIAYIRFAKEEKELFKLLFMRDRTKEEADKGGKEVDEVVAIIMQNTGLSYDQAFMFHIEMWIYVHGIATMLVTSYLDWDWELISKILTDAYEGMKKYYISGEGQK